MSAQLQLLDRWQRRPLEERFAEFHARNPHVWELFERLALRIATRRSRFGAKAIWEVLRYEHAFETDSDDDLKLNNSLTAYYARELIRVHPEHAGLFETRERRG